MKTNLVFTWKVHMIAVLILMLGIGVNLYRRQVVYGGSLGAKYEYGFPLTWAVTWEEAGGFGLLSERNVEHLDRTAWVIHCLILLLVAGSVYGFDYWRNLRKSDGK